MAGYLLLYRPGKMAREKVVDKFSRLTKERERERERERNMYRNVIDIFLIPKLKHIVEPHHNISVTVIHIIWIPKLKRIYLKNQSLVISNLSRE